MRVVVPVPITDNGAGVFERSTTATYFDGSLVMHLAAIDEPRFNREPGTGVTALLLETAATNLIGYSERVDQWTASGATVTTNTASAPDANNTADKLVESATTAPHYTDGPTFTISAGQPFSIQLFLAQAGRTYARVEIRNVNGTTSSVAQTFLLSSGLLPGATVSVGGASVGTIKRPLVASGFQRISFENVLLASDVTQVQVRVYIQSFTDFTDADTNSTTVSYLGDGTNGILIWGLDAKAGATLSSYIPTATSSTVTRAADTYGNMMVSNVAESEPVYSAVTSYALGYIVRGNTTDNQHERFESLAASNSGHALTDLDYWFPLGATNRWAPFDLFRSTGATAASPMYYAITPFTAVDVAAFSNVIADRYTLEVKDETGAVVLTESGELDSGSPRSRAAFDLPEVDDCTITLTLERDDGDVTLGSFDVGVAYDLGETLEGAEDDATNYSKLERDEFGTLLIVPRRSIPRISATSFCTPEQVAPARVARSLLNAAVGLWFGIEDSSHVYFDSMFLRGIYRRFSIRLAVTTAMIDLEIEEV
ncbi:phage head spike fiber domain-containing protein [Phenylobacterium immobile]|uniref:phage head spike fiber domain-containing protein n=1 Tax=Phenylobacterium immobile TaxID=21 RepID=UPI000AF0F400|nr:hypothetical protein [Phenylobacterium immobile]